MNPHRVMPLGASHMERVVFGKQTVLSVLASVWAKMSKPTCLTKIAKPEVNAYATTWLVDSSLHMWHNIRVRIMNSHQVLPLGASHMERVVFGKQTVLSVLASVWQKCPNPHVNKNCQT